MKARQGVKYNIIQKGGNALATVKKKSVASYYLVAALWLIWANVGSLCRWIDYVLIAAASVAVWMLGKAIWPDRSWTTPEKTEKQTAEKQESAPKAEEKRASTGNAELDALLDERDKAVSEMHRLNDAIADETVSAQINRLEETTKKIIQQVVAQPAKLPQIRKFMNYYLPTTLKLLNAYDRMDAVGVSGTNIDGTKGKIEDMMDTICKAFDKQLDALFGEEALDISTDITVMEQMLAREGIGGMTMNTERN